MISGFCLSSFPVALPPPSVSVALSDVSARKVTVSYVPTGSVGTLLYEK